MVGRASSGLPRARLVTLVEVVDSVGIAIRGFAFAERDHRPARRFGSGSIDPSRRVGRVCVGLGTVYFVVMLVRLALGMSVMAHVQWFASPLPAFFHLVLASYVVLFGLVHLSAAAAPAPEAAPRDDRLTLRMRTNG